MSPAVENYLRAHSPQHPVLDELARLTSTMEERSMQIGENQATFMAWMVKLISARRCIEVGVFTGYSSLATALAMPDDGYLLACDVSEDWTKLAREHWERAGVARKIDLVVAPAAATLNARLDAGEAESYDFSFIDADKESYGEYLELCLNLTRPGGVIAFDNMLWGGSVADQSNVRSSTCAIRELNDRAFGDHRVEASLVPVGDGILLLKKK